MIIDLKLEAFIPGRSGERGISGTIIVRVPVDPLQLGWPEQEWQYAGMSLKDYPDQSLFDGAKMEITGVLGFEVREYGPRDGISLRAALEPFAGLAHDLPEVFARGGIIGFVHMAGRELVTKSEHWRSAEAAFYGARIL